MTSNHEERSTETVQYPHEPRLDRMSLDEGSSLSSYFSTGYRLPQRERTPATTLFARIRTQAVSGWRWLLNPSQRPTIIAPP